MIKISYGKTYNTGNYSSERYDIEETYDDDVDPVAAVARLKAIVQQMYAVGPADDEPVDDKPATDIWLRPGETR